MHNLTRADMDWLGRYMAYLEEHHAPTVERVLIHGSKARGNARSDSDIDIVIVVADGTSPEERRELQGMAHEMALHTPALPSIILYSSGNWRRQLRAGYPFPHEVENNAIDARTLAAADRGEARPPEAPPETRKRLALAEWKMANARARHAAGAVGRNAQDDRLSISSSYYTMLHCARAAAVIETGMIPRSLNEAKNVLGRLCRETGHFPDRLGRELHLGLDMRMDADYTPEAEFTRAEAHHEIQAGAEFLDHTRRFLLKRGCTEHELNTVGAP